VRSLVKKARREVEKTGALRVDADPDGAMISVDGREAIPASGKLDLPVGKHLVVITATDRKAYAELVDIVPSKTERLTIQLQQESKSDRAARLVDETVAAPPGKARLIVEEGSDDKVVVRLYDAQLKKVSKPIELEGGASSAAIARKIKAALDPDTMIDADAIAVAKAARGGQRWYERWYVWVAVGAVVAAGGFAGYELASRGPSSVRGF
jgi:hypothetical protein